MIEEGGIIRHQWSQAMQVRGYFGEGEIIAPPRVEATAMPVTSFLVCPLALQGNCSVEVIYRLAYERAQAALRPSWYERLSVACRN